MLKLIIVIACIVALLLWIAHEMKKAPLIPDEYDDSLDNFCPRHTYRIEIKKGEKYKAESRNGYKEVLIIHKIINDKVYIVDSSKDIEMVNLFWLQKQISDGTIEKV